MRTYEELIKLPTFEERLEYLATNQNVCEETFGWDRYLNQTLYNTYFWKNKIRPMVIARDNGCDLGLPGYEIAGRIIVHHMNPLTPEDVEKRDPKIFDPNYLICVSHNTHQAITYGSKASALVLPTIRVPNDTIPWR